MTRLLRTAALILSASVLAAGTGHAQNSAQNPVFSRLTDAERALLFAATGIGVAENFLPGKVAAGLPYRLPTLPRQTVIGSVVQSGGSTVVVRTTAAAEAAHTAALKLLAVEGWRPQYPQTGGAREVFSGNGGNGVTLGPTFQPQCKPGTPGSLTVVTSPAGPSGGTQVSYQYSAFPGTEGTCPANLEWTDPKYANFYAPGRGSGDHDPLADLLARGLKLPSLPGPDGSEVRQSGSSYGPTSYETYATVFSALPAAGLRDHYVRALQGQGWKALPAETLNGEQITRFRYQQGGQEREGVFSLMPRPEMGPSGGTPARNRYDVRLQMSFR